MKWFVTFFGAGLSPIAPGTIGTLAAMPLVFLLGLLPPLIYMIVTFILVIVAIAVCDLYERAVGGHDRSEIVIDEVVGILITMTWMPRTWQAYVLGFVLFRILDILKPFPISYIDRHGKGGFGVVADDVFAGIVASILMQIIYQKTNWLGVQWLIS